MKRLCFLFSFSFLFGSGEYVDNNVDRDLSYVVINYQDEMGNAIEDSVVLEGELVVSMIIIIMILRGMY